AEQVHRETQLGVAHALARNRGAVFADVARGVEVHGGRGERHVGGAAGDAEGTPVAEPERIDLRLDVGDRQGRIREYAAFGVRAYREQEIHATGTGRIGARFDFLRPACAADPA